MKRKRSWTQRQLINAVSKSRSYRQVLHFLKLKEAGGNYAQIKKWFFSVYSGKRGNTLQGKGTLRAFPLLAGEGEGEVLLM